MNREIIPQTDSIKKLAEFWDSHDLTDFEEQLEEVTEKVFERQEALVQIRLGTHEVELVKILAKSKGVDYTDLIREWVMEKL